MRLFLALRLVVLFGFNPRICKRCDKKIEKAIEEIRVSIHASVKDATILNNRRFDLECVSIHASVKDATSACLDSSIFSKCVSIHASVKDATEHVNLLKAQISVSIHASVKDATPCL